MTLKVRVVDDVDGLFRQQFRYETRQGLYALDFALSGNLERGKSQRPPRRRYRSHRLDISMSGTNGLDLLPEATSRRPNRSVFIISAYGNNDSAATALECGASIFLTKPVDFSQLNQTVSVASADARGDV